ncbi:hypothetical protein F5Y15DRAFT_256080 [Xylariaceae sp. FL0016]|nr:hypothetical protein F5Y15DRAFT_256080 [Xylariaceae sp. FL0016]
MVTACRILHQNSERVRICYLCPTYSMLVYLHDSPSPALLTPQSSPNMAPATSSTSCHICDVRSQILDNCEFIVPLDDTVTVITVKEPVGHWKAYAVRCNAESREPLLSSEAADSLAKAMESLHSKSSEATHNYITTNGFAIPPDLTKNKLIHSDDDGDDDDKSSVVSARPPSTTTALSEWDSEDDDVKLEAYMPMPNTTRSAARDKNRRPKPKPRYLDDSDDEDLPRRACVPAPRCLPPETAPMAPPPPPPGWNGPPLPPSLSRTTMSMVTPSYQHERMYPQHVFARPPPDFASSGDVHSNNTNHKFVSMQPPPMASSSDLLPGMPCRPVRIPPPPSSVSTTPTLSQPCHPPLSTEHKELTPVVPKHDVRLTIRWPGHGEARVIECVPASMGALSEAALAYVRSNPGAFGCGAEPWHSITERLVASVRRACFGPVEGNAGKGREGDALLYDMAGYPGDDLSRLFEKLGNGQVPLFEVWVESSERSQGPKVRRHGGL